jgi:hypothetical protein
MGNSFVVARRFFPSGEKARLRLALHDQANREISRSGDTPVAVGSQTAARVPPIRRTACIVG